MSDRPTENSESRVPRSARITIAFCAVVFVVGVLDQIVIADVPPGPAAYDGQFIQIDVVSVIE